MKLPAAELAHRFDGHAGNYDDVEAFWRRACGRVVVTAANPSPEDVVLDLGCGTADLSVDLARRSRRVIGLDLSPAMLGIARARIQNAGLGNIELQEHDFRHLPELPEISLVVSNYAIHHLSLDEKRSLFRQIGDLLPERGVFVMGDVMWSLPIDQIDEPEQFYNPEVDDPSRVEEMVVSLEECGFRCEVLRLSPGVGVIEAWKLKSTTKT
jgi:cyclopropane fatty-acyl-phospholipid synthase-like methyltransferase